jgi:hypothetical protein
LRPNASVGLGSRLLFVARPRLLAHTESTWADGLDRRDTRDASANWTELFVNWQVGHALQFTYGLQNFQWGPAELISPSNRIFHEVGIFRDPIYYVRGKHLARANVSIGKEWSLVTLAELGDNGEVDFNAGEPFRRQGQSKLEYAAPSGVGYVGVTAGARQHAPWWFGEYGSWSLTEGLSVYVDASHTRGSRAWYPVITEDVPRFSRRDADADAWRTLALLGLRYTFVNGVDVRGEYLHQDAGYSTGDLALAASAAAAATSADAFAPYLAPGLELLGRRLALLSVRVPDLPPSKHLVVQGRYLQSFTDRSGVAFVTASLEAANALVLFASATAVHGGDTDELSRLVRGTLVGGAVWTW